MLTLRLLERLVVVYWRSDRLIKGGAQDARTGALVSLRRLWQSVGLSDRLAEAHQPLQIGYDQFYEGFDGVGLQAATILLDELSLS